MKLDTHPRLYLGKQAAARLRSAPGLPFLRGAARQVKNAAARYLRGSPLAYARNVHNEHLRRARVMQRRVVTLLARWAQTGRETYRKAVMGCVEQMAGWEYWSCIAWRRGDSAPDAIFDLSYGENSATLAIAYDWLYGTLSREERDLFLDVARSRAFAAGLKHARPGAAGWFGRPDSNWNAVCAGGLGMLSLAMAEDAPEPRRLLPRVEKSIAPFIRCLDRTSGGWSEGVGYWNYGMRYAFMYLLSHERATGRAHPLLALKGARKTLSFPLDFCPHGRACGFGDSNHWTPLPFHYAAAIRLRRDDVRAALDALLERAGPDLDAGLWPNAAEWLMLHPGEPARRPRRATRRQAVKLYKGLDWAILADAMPDPHLYMAVRGGTSQVPHGHRDLLSFHCVVAGEKLLANVNPAEYLDTTFSSRRREIFEMTPASKNTILINGVGIVVGSSLDSTRRVALPGAEGVRLVATSAMGTMRDGAAAAFCGRLVLLLKRKAFLIVDRVVLPHVGRVESRLHTPAAARVMRRGAVLRGEKATLRVAYTCTVPAILTTARPALTTPSAPPPTMLRWSTERQCKAVTMVTLLSPGRGATKVGLKEGRSSLTIAARGRDWQATARLSERLLRLRDPQ